VHGLAAALIDGGCWLAGRWWICAVRRTLAGARCYIGRDSMCCRLAKCWLAARADLCETVLFGNATQYPKMAGWRCLVAGACCGPVAGFWLGQPHSGATRAATFIFSTRSFLSAIAGCCWANLWPPERYPWRWAVDSPGVCACIAGRSRQRAPEPRALGLIHHRGQDQCAVQYPLKNFGPI